MLTGIIRNVDDLGRVVIPSEWRKALKAVPGKFVELRKEKDVIILRVVEEEDQRELAGIVKTVDKLGRTVIPAEWRRELAIKDDSPVELVKRDSEVHISVREEVCCICRNKPRDGISVLKLHGKLICGNCKKEIVES